MPSNSQFPKDKTPALQDVARQLDQDLKRLKTHFQLLQSDKTTLEGEFERFKKATFRFMRISQSVKWSSMTDEHKARLETFGFKPEDFE